MNKSEALIFIRAVKDVFSQALAKRDERLRALEAKIIGLEAAAAAHRKHLANHEEKIRQLKGPAIR